MRPVRPLASWGSVLTTDEERGHPDLEERVIDLEGGLRVYGMAITDLRGDLRVATLAIADLRAEITALQTITLWVGRVYAWMCNSARHFPWT